MPRVWVDLEELARMKRRAKTKDMQAESRFTGEIVCPECGTKLYHEAGCIRCYSCGWSRC